MSGIQSIPFEPELQVKPDVRPFFDAATNTISYIVVDSETNKCAIIDSVLDIDYAAGRVSYQSAGNLVDAVKQGGWELDWIIETHVHADHLSAAPYIQQQLGGKLGICEKITEVQQTFGKIFNEGTEFERDGSQFDQLFADGDSYSIGNLTAHVMQTPGHTPACTTHVIGNCAFVGDTLFMPDSGSGRADFPGGNARELYYSMKRVLQLPEQTRLFMCHDYGKGGRDIRWESTVQEEREHNIHIHDGVTEEEFVKLREERDKELNAPKLIIPSLQVNMRAGIIPRDEAGNPVLKVPLVGL